MGSDPKQPVVEEHEIDHAFLSKLWGKIAHRNLAVFLASDQRDPEFRAEDGMQSFPLQRVVL